MAHSLVVFPNGSVSIKPVGKAEAMHSSIGPWQEANTLYIDQSGLASRLRAHDPVPLVVYDIGMGIAANALAAIHCFFSSDPNRDLHIVSFEKHLDGLRLARSHSEQFPFFLGFEDVLDDLLNSHLWQGKRGSQSVVWELHEGDFREQNISALPEPEIIFYDFYSPKTGPELWSASCFEKIRARCSSQDRETLLLTYSVATSVRSALLLAGFHVGAGTATEAKRETTVASTILSILSRPLSPTWLAKLERSDKPLPLDWEGVPREEAFSRIKRAPQFQISQA